MLRRCLPILILLIILPREDIRAEVNLADIELPPGFIIEIYAEVPEARSLAKGANGVVFVSNRRKNSVYAIVPGERGRNSVYEIASDLNTPNGIAYFDGDLYVAEIARVLVYRDINNKIRKPPTPEELNIVLPSKSHHGWRYIGFGPDEKMYISIGAPCNICDEDGFAQIIRMNPDGSDRETWAMGIRNSVGFTWHPETDELWFTDNGRDMLGDDSPPGELNHAPRQGMHFGYPYCHGGEVPDPEFGAGRSCADYVAPAQKLGAHVAALGVKFYTGSMFPEEYRGRIFMAEHGSWNRSKKVGYRVTQVSLVDGKAVDYQPFATGWLQGQETRGRPVDLLVLDDGSMLISDDSNGVVYRISYEAKE